MDDKVSIIMPVYNIEKIKKKFIKAVNSVLKSTYKNIELLLINDGSTDKSLDILHKLKKEHSCIIIYSKKNEGVESARRYGLKKCKGKYILHMDQDDYIKKNTIEIFVNRIVNDNSDIVVGNASRFIIFPLFNKKIIAHSLSQNKVIHHDEFMKENYKYFFGINDFPINIWNKLYRKSFLDSIPTPPCTGLINEDLNYNLNIFPLANKISLVKEVTYYYRWGGYTNRYDSSIYETGINCFQIKIEKINQYKLDDLKISTAIEFINYMNSYLYSEMTYKNLTKNNYYVVFKKIIDSPQFKDAKSLLKYNTNYHNNLFDSLISENYEENFKLMEELKSRNKLKLSIKTFLIKYLRWMI